MKINRYIDFLLYSNIFISLCAAALTAETYLLVHSKINQGYILFVFFSTLVLYNFPNLFFASHHPCPPPKEEGGQSESRRWIIENRILLMILTAIALSAILVTVFFFPFKFVVCIIPSAVLAFAYFFPQAHLRNIMGLKAAMVALVWTMVTVFYPLLLISFSGSAWEAVFSNSTIFLVMERFLFLLPLCIIFNVRDMEVDRSTDVRTIPVIYGVKATVIICLLSVFLFSALVIFSRRFSPEAIALITSAIATGMLILKSSPDKDDYFYSFWMDGMIILQAGLVLGIGFLQNFI